MLNKLEGDSSVKNIRVGQGEFEKQMGMCRRRRENTSWWLVLESLLMRGLNNSEYFLKHDSWVNKNILQNQVPVVYLCFFPLNLYNLYFSLDLIWPTPPEPWVVTWGETGVNCQPQTSPLTQENKNSWPQLASTPPALKYRKVPTSSVT